MQNQPNSSLAKTTCYGTDFSTLGDRGLLRRDWVAFFCSTRCPGEVILQAYDQAQVWRAAGQPVIGGFHTPVEQEVLKIMLRSTTPVCVVLARGLPKRVAPEFRKPIAEGRLLIVSPFSVDVDRPTQTLAAERNRIVANMATSIFVAYAAPGSKTEALCRTVVTWEKECRTFESRHTENIVAFGFRAGEDGRLHEPGRSAEPSGSNRNGANCCRPKYDRTAFPN